MAEAQLATNGTMARAITQELGTTGLRATGGQLLEEYDRSWRHPHKYRTIREMMVDPMISRSLWTFDMLIRNVTWDVQAADDSNEALEAAEFVKQVLFEDQSHSWDEALSEHISMIAWGWAWHELVWKRRRGIRNRQQPGENSKFSDGRWGLRKTAPRAQSTWFEWELDPTGGVQAMQQLDTYATPSRGSVRIPIEKSLLFRMSPQQNSPEGRSLLRGAYIPWYYKKNIQRLQGIGIERDLAGLPMIRVPLPILTQAEYAAERATYEKMGANIRRDEQSYVLMPSSRDENGEYVYDLSLISAQGGQRIDTQPIIDNYNKEIVIALITDIILVGHEGVGSLALHSDKTSLMSLGLGGVMESITGVYNRHFMPRLWALNGLPDETMPALTHGDVESVDLDELGNFIVRMAQGGFDLIDLEDEIRRRAGFPLRDITDEEDPLLNRESAA